MFSWLGFYSDFIGRFLQFFFMGKFLQCFHGRVNFNFSLCFFTESLVGFYRFFLHSILQWPLVGFYSVSGCVSSFFHSILQWSLVGFYSVSGCVSTESYHTILQWSLVGFNSVSGCVSTEFVSQYFIVVFGRFLQCFWLCIYRFFSSNFTVDVGRF